ncbi:Gfo/Idh/MocA family protein [Azospirillum doebereinerae]|uniref:Gfo/Idh/MocA family oxidoreductase n=1 Tax=Azospirillum doebereinerae TaxID=92933 RepID=A0A3S0V6V8_9PROT|nr:Gfo/Idh/MocA family oxidoreductase [Azospirillum doebereinerae]RUQ72081.1 Gfo/Idh/MocA family oxidoreductase [Azospirillum doebereinerae]
MTAFALVGCGRIAKRHADLLAGGQIKGATLAAVAEVKDDRLRNFTREYGVPGYADYHAMMEAMGDRIDVVSVLTESGNHARHTIDLARYGKHVVVEKPMALTLPDAEAMIRACDSANVKLFVVKQNRCNLPVVRLRQAVAAGRFGKIVMGTVRVRWSRPQAYYDQDPWRGTLAMDGGVFANQASHHVDLLEWLLGEPDTVFAKARTALVDIEAEDTGVALITFASGAIGVVEATTAVRPKDLEGSISILGERGTVEIGGFAVNEMKTWNFVDQGPEDEAVLRECRETPPDVYGFGHKHYLNNVVDSIQHGGRALVDGLEGYKSLVLLSAIYESIAQEQEVRLRFRPRISRLGLERPVAPPVLLPPVRRLVGVPAA